MQDQIQSIIDTVYLFGKATAPPYGGMLKRAVVAKTPVDARILEIGPGATPTFSKSRFKNLKMLDYYATDELIAHFSKDFHEASPPDKFPPIDYVSKDGDIRAAIPYGVHFDLIFSSHNIEHQPDLLRHLNGLESVLAPDGAIIFLVPDKRCTFDIYRPVSQTGDVLQANRFIKRNAREGNAFSYFANMANFYSMRAARSDDAIDFVYDLDTAYLKFLEASNENNEYADIHNWAFTPESLNIILIELFMLKKTTLLSPHTSNTYGHEFMIILKKVEGMRDGAVSPDVKKALHERRLSYYKALTFGGGFAVL